MCRQKEPDLSRQELSSCLVRLRKFLVKCKPFSAKHIAETVGKNGVPDSIKQIVTKAVALVE